MQTFIVIERRGRYARADDRHLGVNRTFVRAQNGRTKHFATEESAWRGGEMALNRSPGASIVVMPVEG